MLAPDALAAWADSRTKGIQPGAPKTTRSPVRCRFPYMAIYTQLTLATAKAFVNFLYNVDFKDECRLRENYKFFQS
jgi:hypothetical protein